MDRSEIEEILPLSPMQVGLLYQTLAGEGTGAYVQQLTCTARGRLEPGAFREAWKRVVERHAVLRTLIEARRDGEPLQVVRRSAPLPFVEEDWRALPEERQCERAHALLAADRERGFDLSAAPLMRVALFRLRDDCFRLQWTVSHIVLDGWSTAELLGEVLTLHRAIRDGVEPRLPPRRPFRDYLAWLREQPLGESKAYWSQLARSLPERLDTLEARLGDERADGPSHGEQEFELDAGVAAVLRREARRGAVPLATVIQAAWALVLARRTGRSDCLYGLTVSGRAAELPGVERMVGAFINTLPIRTGAHPGESLRGWLGRLHRSTGEAQQHQMVSLAEIQKMSGGGTLFDSVLVFEDYPGTRDWERIDPELEIADSRFFGRTEYPLTLVVEPGRTLLVRLLHDARRCPPAAAAGLLSSLSRFLREMGRGFDRRADEIPLLTPDEFERTVVQWNRTSTSYPRDTRVHELFAEQVVRWPDRIAVQDGSAQLSYAALAERAHQLANHLVECGVTPGTRIAVCVDRSVELVVALLAVLEAGAAYVPLDPSYPEDRLAFMLADSGAPLLLTVEALLDRLPVSHALPLCLDRDAACIAMHENDPPNAAGDPRSLAYVMYTSGSTGQPKGIAVPHRAIVRLVRNTDYISLDESDVVAQCSNASFDASTFEIWGALLHGARLVLIQKECALSPRDFVRELSDRGATTLFLTTALFNHVAEEAPGFLASLRHLLFGGEAVDCRWVRRVLDRGRPGRLLHVYGPTESTTFASWHPVREVGAEATTIPIGRPIANTRIHLLEADRMRPVPVGVPGELCIGGDGLAWGYLDRPELTGACFVPDPWSGEPGARLYRTGDLGRYRPDGSIEFLGRRDHQIKLRGNRIELEEIESVLRSSHAIHDAAVVHRGDGGGGRLVAYVAAKNRDEMDASAVRTHLRTRLPEYMLPAEIVFVGDLPLTVNGKVDRAALAALGAPAAGRGPDPALPESELQRQLAAVWSNVLGAEHVGLHENFFDLGGHSLLVVRILNRLRLELGRSVTVAEFFKHPTVAGLADFLEGRERELRIDDIRGRASRQLASLSAQRNRKATETGR